MSNKKQKHHKKNEKIIEESIIDDRFEDLDIKEKKPPVDLYGRPISGLIEDYISSEDEFFADPFQKYENSESEEEIRTKISTSRLAIKNLDWKRLSSTDIFSIISLSCSDLSKDLLNVTVFVSQFGEKYLNEHQSNLENISELDQDVQSAAWRHHKRQLEKCYFAILEFSTSSSADSAYEILKNCDILDTGNFIDISVVPDEIDFSTFQIRDKSNSKPEDWNLPDLGIKSDSSTKLIDDWDSNDPNRIAAIEAAWEDDGEKSYEIISSLLLASDDENDKKPTRESLKEIIKALEEEEDQDEDKNDNDSDEINITFEPKKVDKKNKKNNEEIEEIFKEAKKNKKNKKVEKVLNNNINDEEVVNSILEDDRFKDELEKPGYGISATDKDFNPTPTMNKLRNQIAKRHLKK